MIGMLTFTMEELMAAPKINTNTSCIDEWFELREEDGECPGRSRRTATWAVLADAVVWMETEDARVSMNGALLVVQALRMY